MVITLNHPKGKRDGKHKSILLHGNGITCKKPKNKMANTTKANTANNDAIVTAIKTGEITDTPKQSHKSRNDNYVIVYRLKNDTKDSKITNFTTCAEIKAWLRETHRGTIGKLHIFKSDGKTPCRLSAWIN